MLSLALTAMLYCRFVLDTAFVASSAAQLAAAGGEPWYVSRTYTVDANGNQVIVETSRIDRVPARWGWDH